MPVEPAPCQHGAVPAAQSVASSSGVTIALHDLGGVGPPLLLCHPTGFHALTWAPVAAHVGDTAHSWALDFRGHGDSTSPNDGDYRWSGMVDDVLAAIEHLRGHEVLAGGHSMGGAALLMAEQRRPGTFDRLWCFEPIVLPRQDGLLPPNPIATAARRRKSWFPDRDTAFANYAMKPPLNSFAPEAIAAYVAHGFRDVPGGGVELKCTPEVEAAVFEQPPASGSFERLAEVRCPVTVVASGDGGMPARLAPLIVDVLPEGRLEHHPRLTHFGPMEDPATIGESIRTALLTP